MYKRRICETLLERMREERRFMQVVAGPRQVGKTHAVRQALKEYEGSAKYALAEAIGADSRQWLEGEWNAARLAARKAHRHLLVIDEIQKIPGWSETVKRLWDQDTFDEMPLKVILMGSSRLLIQKGLAESLAGRFELIHAGHWTYSEMREAFGFSLEDYILFGSYPGAAALRRNEERWRAYIRESIVEPSISNDILQLDRISKPALLRQVFFLSCMYSARILSYQKMLGQLQDAGNATTLAHYLRLLGEAGLVAGLEKHFAEAVRSKASSPKLAVHNNALASALSTHPLVELRSRPDLWGHLVESAAGAHLLATTSPGTTVSYWNDGAREVDFIVSRGERIAALEIKSGAVGKVSGLQAFQRRHPDAKCYIVGAQGLDLETFFTTPADDLL